MNNVRDIQAKIAKLEEEKARLIPLRKEEIFNVLEASGGMALDNSLLAGLAMYANSEEGKKSTFLQELSALGKRYLPRHRPRKDSKENSASNKADLRASSGIKAEKGDG